MTDNVAAQASADLLFKVHTAKNSWVVSVKVFAELALIVARVGAIVNANLRASTASKRYFFAVLHPFLKTRGLGPPSRLAPRSSHNGDECLYTAHGVAVAGAEALEVNARGT